MGDKPKICPHCLAPMTRDDIHKSWICYACGEGYITDKEEEEKASKRQ